jgi:hypothetical protein
MEPRESRQELEAATGKGKLRREGWRLPSARNLAKRGGAERAYAARVSQPQQLPRIFIN